MDDRSKLLLGMGLGAAGMYYLDPARGRHRRALARNRLVHAGHKTLRALDVTARDLSNRAAGITAETRSMLRDSRAEDAVLVDRVRSCLGRVVSHPASVRVEARDGVVTLTGPILEHEVPGLLECVRGVQGVMAVHNELDEYAEPGRIPGLQGVPRPRTGSRPAFLQANWPPAARALGGAVGTAAALYGLGRRDPASLAVAAGGALLLARSATNLELRRLLGIGVPRHAVEVQKSIRIHAPVERIFSLWEDFESFPKFMTHVRRVRPIRTSEDGQRWRWTVRGAGGVLELDFDTVVTAREANRMIAWRTEGSAFVRHAGVVRFHRNDDGSTTANVDMVYNPVAGAIGHAVACLVGADPKRQMDDDLLRLKTFIETGRPPRDAARPELEGELPAGQEIWRHEAPPPREAGMPGVR